MSNKMEKTMRKEDQLQTERIPKAPLESGKMLSIEERQQLLKMMQHIDGKKRSSKMSMLEWILVTFCVGIGCSTLILFGMCLSFPVFSISSSAKEYKENNAQVQSEGVQSEESHYSSNSKNNSETIASSRKSNNSSKNQSFTNAYGTANTKCAHPGCDNYIATSGDTNCCTIHSNKCLNCGKYIDGDAMFCMSCLKSAASKSSSSKENYSYGGSNSSITGNDGYELPNENDKSFPDYVKRVAPDLYKNMEDRYNSLS